MFYHQMSHNFTEVFKQLVPHGKATLVMKTDPVEQTVKTIYVLFVLRRNPPGSRVIFKLDKNRVPK